MKASSMRLHRYFSSHADTTLREGRLRLSHASALNDPFEFVHNNTGRMTEADALAFFTSSLGQSAITEFRPKAESENPELAKKFFNDLPALAQLFAACDPGAPIVEPAECHRIAD